MTEPHAESDTHRFASRTARQPPTPHPSGSNTANHRDRRPISAAFSLAFMILAAKLSNGRPGRTQSPPDLDGPSTPDVAGGAELDSVHPGVVGGAGPVRVMPLRGISSEDPEQAEGVPPVRHREPDQVPGPGVGVAVRSVLRLELGQPAAADADLPAQRGVHEASVDVTEAGDLRLRRDQLAGSPRSHSGSGLRRCSGVRC